MTIAFVGLGGNTLPARRSMRTARQKLRHLPGARLLAVSPTYESAPINCPGRQRSYCNAVAQLQTMLPPQRLFYLLQAVERKIQRRRRRRNAPRHLDLDYLLHGGASLRGPHLALPHPRMLKRAFVLRPLADLVGGHFCGVRGGEPLSKHLRRCRGQALRRLS